jgi:hypothetical protein
MYLLVSQHKSEIGFDLGGGLYSGLSTRSFQAAPAMSHATPLLMK